MAIDSMDKLVAAYASTSQLVYVNRSHEVSGVATAINTNDPVDGWAESTTIGWRGTPIGDTTAIGSSTVIQVVGAGSPTTGFPVCRFSNPGGSNKLYLASVQTAASTQLAGATSQAAIAGSLLIFDRIASYRFPNTSNVTWGAGAFPLPAGARNYNNGVGVRIAVESLTTTAGGSTLTVGYTNSSGTAGRTTPTRLITAGTNRYNFSILPLQAGDSGVKEINSITNPPGANSLVTLFRPIAQVPVSVHGNFMDFGATGLPEIPTDCGLSVAWVGNTGAISPVWSAILRLVEG